jgi:hypothetical protein
MDIGAIPGTRPGFPRRIRLSFFWRLGICLFIVDHHSQATL